ncbi:MAG: NAD-dependent epimerase/dehydratase family protein [bacterium]
MKVLLTGYAGFLGNHIARALRKENHTLRVVLHTSTVARRDLPAETEIVWGSVADADTVNRAVAGVDSVVHCAWSFRAPEPGHPGINIPGTELLFSESVAAGVKSFAFVSSVAVYGMEENGGAEIDERTPLTKLQEDRYPVEKIQIEKMLHALERGKTRLGIFRPGPIFDETKSFIKKIAGRKGFCLAIGLGNGQNLMPNIHASDVASAITAWLARGKDGDVFNVTPTGQLAQKQWYRSWGAQKQLNLKQLFVPPALVRAGFFGVRVLKKGLGKPGKSNIDYALACATRNLRYSNAHLRKSLGWQDVETKKYTG